jgi:carboxyl-terminal processing protease
MELTDAVNKIRGPAGTKVKLEIIRPGEIEKIKKEVLRRKIEVPSVDSKTLTGSIGYITLSIF